MEDLVNSSPDVELSAAFPIRATEGDEDDVVVFVVPRAGVVLTAKDLHAWADREMPKYMRPEHVRIVDDIPRTPTNKIEKYKLRAQILRRAAQPVTAVRTVRYGPEEVGGVTHPAAAQPGHPGASTRGWCARRRSSTSSTSNAPRGAPSYSQFSWEKLEGRFLGPMAYPDPKGDGDKSMPGKRRSGSGVRDDAPRDPELLT